jgi:hypothetical protein
LSRPGDAIKKPIIAPPISGAIVRPTSVADEYHPSISPLFLVNRSAIMAETTGPRIAVANPWKNLMKKRLGMFIDLFF